MIRALAVLLPALLFGSFLLKTAPKVAFGLVVAWVIAFLISEYVKIGRFGYTLLTAVCVGYLFSIVKTITTMMAKGENAFAHLYEVFIASGIMSVIFLGLLIPAWALFYFLDIMICNALSQKK